MKLARVLLLAVVFLGSGVWLLFDYGHGTSGLSFALPVAASKYTIDLTTTGIMVWISMPLIAIGLALLAVAVLTAIVVQFVPQRHHAQDEETLRRTMHMGD